ncbi:hypothetical protein RRG08_060488 [Elysia crispata]|uniref:Endonuclease/exonuclease/phosphatase domain-containing protein n=1 Tax=Elysia crispata TaxID=231223 RepID=A0AAE1E7E9_9GAST|nr:hypothetical protein RRG08_060488 [Elysia crispata]
MYRGLSDDLQQANNARKTAITDREPAKRNIDIVALQETRLAASGSLKEKEHTFFWQGLGPDKHRIHGVGFALRNSKLSSSPEVKNVFYEELQERIRGIPNKENLIQLG